MDDMGQAHPLAGIRVVDLSHHAGGSYGGLMMAKLGADVIKVERPITGDPLREIGPFGVATGKADRGGAFASYNMGKKGITLDWKTQRGREILRELIMKADVIWENYTPGTLARAGFSYADVRRYAPSIVYASMSGYGHYGTENGGDFGRPMLDLVAQAMGGVMEMTGQYGGPPTLIGPNIGDLVPAVFLALGVASALYKRQMTGEGSHVDVAMIDGMVAMSERAIMTYSVTGEVPTRGRDARLAPWGAFKAADAYVVIACSVESIWDSLCSVMARPDLRTDPRLQTGPGRADHLDAIIEPAIEAWLKDKTARQAADMLSAAGVPAGPVQSAADLAEWDHVAVRHMLYSVDDPVLGPVRLAGNPIKLDGISHDEIGPAPLLGEHNEEVLGALLGIAPGDLTELARQGVI